MAALRALPEEAPRGRVSGGLTEILREAIVRAELPPGTALTEADVADRFGVSRTPVRESFRMLSSEGLLDISPQRGTYVSKLRRSRLQDALFVREALECSAAQLAAAASVERRRLLRRIVQRQRDAISDGDVDGTLQADEDLHRAILDLSGHGATWPLVQQARSHLARLRRIANRELRGSEDALEHHELIVDAIVAGNGPQAAELLRAHVKQVQRFIDRIAQIHPEYVE